MTLAETSQIILAVVALVGIGAVLGRILFSGVASENETAEVKGKIAALEKGQLETKLILKQIAKKLKISY